MSGVAPINLGHLPNDALTLIHMAAYLLQIPPIDKQKILEEADAGALVAQVQRLYRREVTLIGALLHQPRTNVRGFGLN